MTKFGKTVLAPVELHFPPKEVAQQNSTSNDTGCDGDIMSVGNGKKIVFYTLTPRKAILSPPPTWKEEVLRNPSDAMSNRLGQAKALREKAAKLKNPDNRKELIDKAVTLEAEAERIRPLAEKQLF